MQAIKRQLRHEEASAETMGGDDVDVCSAVERSEDIECEHPGHNERVRDACEVFSY